MLRPVKGGKVSKRTMVQKKNPLRNWQVQLRLNPYAAQYKKEKIAHQKYNNEEQTPRAKEFEKLIHEN